MVLYQELVVRNCIGIPTVVGETKFNSTYNENILVNAMAVGLANKQDFIPKLKELINWLFMLGPKQKRRYSWSLYIRRI